MPGGSPGNGPWGSSAAALGATASAVPATAAAMTNSRSIYPPSRSQPAGPLAPGNPGVSLTAVADVSVVNRSDTLRSLTAPDGSKLAKLRGDYVVGGGEDDGRSGGCSARPGIGCCDRPGQDQRAGNR